MNALQLEEICRDKGIGKKVLDFSYIPRGYIQAAWGKGRVVVIQVLELCNSCQDLLQGCKGTQPHLPPPAYTLLSTNWEYP